MIRVTRSIPSTSSSTMSSFGRDILRMIALVPTVYRSSCFGDSTEASRWANNTISFSSVASAASTAASEDGRPTDNGISRYGNKTVFFSGRTAEFG